jgi:hypothetical protein
MIKEDLNFYFKKSPAGHRHDQDELDIANIQLAAGMIKEDLNFYFKKSPAGHRHDQDDLEIANMDSLPQT